MRRVVLEPHVGGRIFEEHMEGRRFQVGSDPALGAAAPQRRLRALAASCRDLEPDLQLAEDFA